MTTIAWDGKALATDSQATAHNIVVSSNAKKIITPTEDEIWRVRGEKVIAVASCGAACALDELQEALSVGIVTSTKMRSGLEFTAILVTTSGGAIEIYKDDGKEEIGIYRLSDPRAFGSGGDFALSAMKMGMTAEEAVKHAIGIDIYSGGEVQVFTVSKGD